MSERSNVIGNHSSIVKIAEADRTMLLEMLAFMQAELEAREIVIATLKSENCKQLLYQAKYGRLNTALVSPKISSDSTNDTWAISNNEFIFSIYDPFTAMQRDIQHVIMTSDQSIDCDTESYLKPVYDSQLNQLENLISSQKKAQMKMKEQIIYLEKKCLKLTQALEDERNKHERDAAQGDDVLVMLEKERERLKSELDYERSHSRKLEREVKRMVAVIEDQNSVIYNQRLAASVIIRTKNQIESDLKTMNTFINKTVNVNELTVSEISTKHNQQELIENPSNNETSQHGLLKSNIEWTGDSSERLKECLISKSSKQNSLDGPSIAKHDMKHTQYKEISLTSSPDPILAMSHQVTSPVPKGRVGKQPESLLWKTYDPKNTLTNSALISVTLTMKSPSSVRRQLPNVSMSTPIPLSRHSDNTYYKHSSSPSVSTISSPAITPYQKILSTPPPNSIINQTASFQSSLTSYGLFNICSPALQSLGTSPALATIYKSTISSTKAEIVNCQPNRSRIIAGPSTMISTSSAASSSAMIRSSDSSPAIPKHVYVNGK